MRRRAKLCFFEVCIAIAVAGYFGVYLLAASYSEVSVQPRIYILNYNVGSHSLYGWRSFFEPARRMDEFLRERPAVIVSGGS